MWNVALPRYVRLLEGIWLCDMNAEVMWCCFLWDMLISETIFVTLVRILFSVSIFFTSTLPSVFPSASSPFFLSFPSHITSSQVRKGSTGGLAPYGSQYLSGSTEMGRYLVSMQVSFQTVMFASISRYSRGWMTLSPWENSSVLPSSDPSVLREEALMWFSRVCQDRDDLVILHLFLLLMVQGGPALRWTTSCCYWKSTIPICCVFLPNGFYK